MTTPAPETTVQRHPIRGAMYGLLIGLGVAIYLVIFAVTPFAIATIVTVVVAAMAVGLVFGAIAPARKTSTMPPSATSLNTTFTRTGEAAGEDVPSYEAAFGPAPKGASTVDATEQREEADGFFGG